jgi:peroxiredoxin
LPTKEKLYQEFNKNDLVILAISFKEPEDLVRNFQKEFNLSFPVLFDPEGKVAEKYEFRGHPVTFLIDRDGLLVGKVIGERNWFNAEAQMVISKLLQTTKKPTPNPR